MRRSDPDRDIKSAARMRRGAARKLAERVAEELLVDWIEIGGVESDGVESLYGLGWDEGADEWVVVVTAGAIMIRAERWPRRDYQDARDTFLALYAAARAEAGQA